MLVAPGGERQLTRVDAAHRVVGSCCFVCPVGWSTEMFELQGAASAVWQSLRTPLSTAELATIHGVPSEDEFLLAAVTMLLESALVEPVDDDAPTTSPRG